MRRRPSEPLERSVAGHYLPALDGVRALAIASVIAYHLDYGWAAGGFLGVDLFFVLSGFLITTLLIEERAASGTVRFGAFWSRRAKRLLPALLVMLVAVSIFVAVSPGTTDLSQLRGDGIATIFYFANWHLLLARQSYFSAFEAPSPLQHTWSLAIEEQFYLVWPFVIAGLLFLGRSLRRNRVRRDTHVARAPELWRSAGLALTVGGAVLSAAWMAYLIHSGAGINRVYYGTDTRAFDLLAGAVAAMFAASRPQPSARTRTVLHVLSAVCLCIVVLFWGLAGTAGGPRTFMFYGGFLAYAAVSAVLVSDVRQLSAGPVGRVLSIRPVRWIGKISYGLYLWHLPVIIELDSGRVGLSGWRLACVQVSVTVVVATLSFYLIERPIRRMHWSRLPMVIRAAVVPAAMAFAAVAVVVATLPAPAAPSERVVVSPKTPGAGLKKTRTSSGTTLSSIKLPPGVPSRSDPLRILLLGDSVMQTEAPALQAAFDSTGEATVVSDAASGWGLTTSKNWPTLVPQVIRRDRPDLVVAMWEWDDSCLVPAADQSTGPCSIGPVRYRALLERFIGTVLAPGDGVAGLMFEQYPTLGLLFSVTQLQERLTGERAWDSLVSSMVSVFPGRVMYMPLAPAVELNGRFSVWLPPEDDPSAPMSDWVRVRMLDNTHFCPAGAARYAAALLADLTSLYHLAPPAPDWSTGTWTDDAAVYNNPPGSCPDDHP